MTRSATSDQRRSTTDPTLVTGVVGEFVGTAFLLIAVVGSGIMAQRTSDDTGVQLLANALATAGALVALISAFGGACDAHFNPLVTIVDAVLRGDLGSITGRLRVGAYVVAQTAGGCLGVMAANIVFDLPAVRWSTTDRSSLPLAISEAIATLGLLLVIFLTVRRGEPRLVAFVVAGYIAGAYWFTSSTSFANPAVTLARTMSDTFAGIEPGSVPGFVVAQLVGAAVALPLIRLLAPDRP